MELQWLEKLIERDYPLLECKIYEDDKFLRVTKYYFDGVCFLPNFYFVFKSLQNGNICSRLVTYHGKTLFKTIFSQNNDEIIPKKLDYHLKQMSLNMKLCQGISKENIVSSQCLLEHLNDNLVARNYHCVYLLQENTIIDTCHECQKINSLKKDLDCLNDSADHQNLKGDAINGLDKPNDAIIQTSLIHSLLEKQNDEDDQEENLGSLRYLLNTSLF